MTQVLEALKARYDRYDPEDWFTVGIRSNPIDWLHFQVKNIEGAAQAINGHVVTDVWSSMAVFGQEPGNGLKGTAEEVSKCAWLWVDVDCHDNMDKLPEVKQRVEAFNYPKPTTIVFSGRGYHAYWAIEPTFDKEAVEERNKWLRYRLEGDHVQNVDRIMRVPGTWNLLTDPYTLCEAKGSGRTYTLDDFTTPDGYAEQVRSYIDFEFEPIPQDFTERVRKFTDKKSHLWDRIYTEESALKRDAPLKGYKKVDRSENDYFIACKLLGLDYSPGVVASVLSHPTWFSGERGRGNWDYVVRTVRAAHAAVSSIPMPEIKLGIGDSLFDEGIATKSIGEYFNLCSYQKLPYYYYDGEWLNDIAWLGTAILFKKLGEYIKLDNINKLIPLLKALALTRVQDGEDNKEWVSVENGLLNLRTRELIDHTSDKFVTNRIPVRYESEVPKETYERVKAYVRSVVDDGDMALYEHVGWCLTSDMKLVAEPAALILYGPPRTGKSELLYFVRGFLGAKNGSTIDLAHLTGDQDYYAYGLLGMMYNMVFDSNMNAKWKHPDKLKDLISGEPTAFREIYGSVTDTDTNFQRNRTKFWLATNRLPQAIGSDDALYRRLVILECNNIWRVDTPGHQTGIGEHLAEDPMAKSAFLNLALDGYDRLAVQKKHTQTNRMVAAINKTREANSSVEEWRVACTASAPGELVKTSDAFDEYKSYCNEVGRMACKKGEFIERMLSMGNERPELRINRLPSKWIPELKNNYDCWEGMKLTKTYRQRAKAGPNGTIHITSDVKSYQEN